MPKRRLHPPTPASPEHPPPPLPQRMRTPSLKGACCGEGLEAGRELSPSRSACWQTPSKVPGLNACKSLADFFLSVKPTGESNFVQIPRFCVSATSPHNGLRRKPLGSTAPTSRGPRTPASGERCCSAAPLTPPHPACAAPPLSSLALVAGIRGGPARLNYLRLVSEGD